MGVITGYPDDTSTTDSDKFLTSDSSGATKLTAASTLKDYVLADGNVTSPKIDLSSLYEYKKITTSKTAVIVSGAYADLTDYNITKTVLSGQTLLIEFFMPQVSSTTDAVRHDFAIVEDGTTTVQTHYERIWLTANGGNIVTLKALVTPTAGEHTWKVRVATPGNVTVTAYANATAGTNFAYGICSASVVGN